MGVVMLQNCLAAKDSHNNNSCFVISKSDLGAYGCPCCGENDGSIKKMHPTFSQKSKSICFFECPHCANSFITVKNSFKDVLSINIQSDPNELYFSFVNKVQNHPYKFYCFFENTKFAEDYFYSELLN
jgi:hypothetical protein